MTDKEAMKLALDALELVNIEFVCNGAHHAKKDRHGLDEDCPVTMRYRKAITALKERLAQPEQKPFTYYNPQNDGIRPFCSDGDIPLYTTPPQRTEQEPVAVYGYCPTCGAKGVMRERRPNGSDKCANGHTYLSSKATTPPQRKPLTDEQIYDMYNEPRSDAEMIAFARAIEAAHGIKENT